MNQPRSRLVITLLEYKNTSLGFLQHLRLGSIQCEFIEVAYSPHLLYDVKEPQERCVKQTRHFTKRYTLPSFLLADLSLKTDPSNTTLQVAVTDGIPT